MSACELVYEYHAVRSRPRCWSLVSDILRRAGAEAYAERDGLLFGVFRSQIGRPRDELSVITAAPANGDTKGAKVFFAPAREHIVSIESQVMHPTLRPERFEPPRRQGNFAFRWFETPKQNYAQFLQLCAAAWPDFEAAYNSQVLGLWRIEPPARPRRGNGCVRTLLLTRRPDLAMWERSKIPRGRRETNVREQLSRRYDLCDNTFVFTTTLLTADDNEDTVRWT